MSGAERASRDDKVARSVLDIIRKDFLASDAELDPDASLFASGVIDSMGFIRLLARLESELGVEIPMSDIIIEDFDSVNKIAAAVRRRLPRR